MLKQLAIENGELTAKIEQLTREKEHLEQQLLQHFKK